MSHLRETRLHSNLECEVGRVLSWGRGCDVSRAYLGQPGRPQEATPQVSQALSLRSTFTRLPWRRKHHALPGPSQRRLHGALAGLSGSGGGPQRHGLGLRRPAAGRRHMLAGPDLFCDRVAPPPLTCARVGGLLLVARPLSVSALAGALGGGGGARHKPRLWGCTSLVLLGGRRSPSLWRRPPRVVGCVPIGPVVPLSLHCFLFAAWSRRCYGVLLVPAGRLVRPWLWWRATSCPPALKRLRTR